MWCGKCQADVAAEVSPDNQRVFCTNCGALLSTIDLPPTRPVAERLGDRTKDARELLQRWSSGQVLDPFGPVTKVPSPPSAIGSIADPASGVASAPRSSVTSPDHRGADATPFASDSPVATESPSPAIPSVPEVKRDLFGEPVLSPIANPLAASSEPSWPTVTPNLNPLATPAEATSSAPVTIPSPFVTAAPPTTFYRVDAAHPADHFTGAKKAIAPSEESAGPFASKAPAPETKREPRRPMLWFPTWDPAVWRSEPSTTGNWSSMAGQFLAYAGVLGLTAGACLVVWSYFGGPANYAPMGWLLATAGQMLLFFGVVTLVSGGLEQTTEQVNKRIEQLGDHIIRIEQAAREISLRGPVPPAHFGNEPDSAVPPRSAASGYERSVIEE